MSTQVGLSNTQKSSEICSTCSTANLPNNPHFDSVQNHHTKQESVNKAVVSAFPQTPRFAALEQRISKVNNSKRKTLQEGQNFIPAVKESAFVKACIAQGVPDYTDRYKKLVGDAMTLPKTELQKLYPAEYNSLRDRKRAAKELHIHFDKRLSDLRDWLIHLGEKPSDEHTVDRIKSAKTTGYRPGNVRWATKYTQTINRGVTKWHKMNEGPDLTTKQLAKRLGTSYHTLYRQLARGHTVASLLGEPLRRIEDWQFPHELAEYCDSLYHQRKTFKTSRLEWFIDHLDSIVYGEKRGNELSLDGLAFSNLLNHLTQARQDRQNIIQNMKNYEESKLKELIAIYDPPDQAISLPVPANDTTPQQPLPVAAQARLQPRPVAQKELPYRPSPAEIAETMEKLREVVEATR